MNGDFTIAKITFEPASGATAGDECDLLITDSLLLTADPIPNEIIHTKLNGTARIKSTTPGGGGGGGIPPIENQMPIADASASETFGYVNAPVRFDGSRSKDNDGEINLYEWDWNNDGRYDIELVSSTTIYTFNEVGTYVVSLRVTDNEGATDKDTINVEIAILNNPPSTPVISGPTTGQQNIEYEFTALSSDVDNHSIQYIFDWNDGGISTTEFLSNGTTAKQSHSWDLAGEFIISVKAYDNETESASVKYSILIDVLPINNGISGYLVDDDSDGTYDSFDNSETGEKTDIELQDDGTYLIDSDGDGEWDYVYDIETDKPSEYEGEPESEEDNTALYALLLIIIILLILFGYLAKRSKDKKKKAEAEKKAEEEKKKKAAKKKPTKKKTSSAKK